MLIRISDLKQSTNSETQTPRVNHMLRPTANAGMNTDRRQTANAGMTTDRRQTANARMTTDQRRTANAGVNTDKRQTTDTGFGDNNVNATQYVNIGDNNRASPAAIDYDEKVERSKPLANQVLANQRTEDQRNLARQKASQLLQEQGQIFQAQRQSDREESINAVSPQLQSHRAEAEQKPGSVRQETKT